MIELEDEILHNNDSMTISCLIRVVFIDLETFKTRSNYLFIVLYNTLVGLASMVLITL